jgi:hypothetical protein
MTSAGASLNLGAFSASVAIAVPKPKGLYHSPRPPGLEDGKCGKVTNFRDLLFLNYNCLEKPLPTLPLEPVFPECDFFEGPGVELDEYPWAIEVSGEHSVVYRGTACENGRRGTPEHEHEVDLDAFTFVLEDLGGERARFLGQTQMWDTRDQWNVPVASIKYAGSEQAPEYALYEAHESRQGRNSEVALDDYQCFFFGPDGGQPRYFGTIFRSIPERTQGSCSGCFPERISFGSLSYHDTGDVTAIIPNF